LDTDRLGSLLAVARINGCCRQNCLSRWSVNDILPFRKQYAQRNERERLEFVIELLKQMPKSIRGYNSYVLTAASTAFRVCRDAFAFILGTSSYKITRAHALLEDGLHAPVHGNLGHREHKGEEVIEVWLKGFVEDTCDKISDKCTLLPTSLSWHAVYAEFARQQADGHAPTFSTFCEVRRHKFPHLRRPRAGTLAHCDVCFHLRRAVKRSPTDATRKIALAAKDRHTALFTRERVFMQENMRHCAAHPSDRVMLFIDYSAAIKLPHFERTPSVPLRPQCMLVLTCPVSGRVSQTSSAHTTGWFN